MIKKFTSHLALLILLLVSAGCAMNTVYDLNPEVSVGSLGDVAVLIEDARPHDEKKKSYGSMIIGTSNYGIWTLGDESFAPAPIEALRQRVMQAASQQDMRMDRVAIKVHHLVVQDNQQAAMLRQGSADLGPLGVAIAETIHGQKFELEYDKSRPFVILFFKADVTIDGGTRTVSFSKARNYSSNIDHEGRAEATRNTVETFFDTVGEIVLGG